MTHKNLLSVSCRMFFVDVYTYLSFRTCILLWCVLEDGMKLCYRILLVCTRKFVIIILLILVYYCLAAIKQSRKTQLFHCCAWMKGGEYLFPHL